MAKIRIYFVAGGLSFAAVVVGIFILFFYCGLHQHDSWGALEDDVAEAIIEAEEGRRGERVESWRNQENADPWVVDFLRERGMPSPDCRGEGEDRMVGMVELGTEGYEERQLVG